MVRAERAILRYNMKRKLSSLKPISQDSGMQEDELKIQQGSGMLTVAKQCCGKSRGFQVLL